VRGKIASPIPGQRIELARCVASAIVKIMREKRSRREADVYKAKIGRDAIIDIHVRRYSSKPYYFHPKSTGAVSGKRVQERTHISSGGPSKIRRRQTDRQKDRKTDISTSQSAEQRRTQPGQDADAKCRLPSTAPQHRTTADFASLYLLPLSHKRRNFNISKRKSRLETSWVSNIHFTSRIFDSSTGTSILEAGTGSLALSRRDSPSPTREVGSPALRPQPQSLFFAGLI